MRVSSKGSPASGPAFAAALLAGSAFLPSAAKAQCDDILPPVAAPPAPNAPAEPDGGGRSVTADDLVRLRDLGPAGSAFTDTPSPLAISPGGKEVAFELSRADPVANRYCRALLVLSLAGEGEKGAVVAPEGQVRVLSRGGGYLFKKFPFYGTLIANGFNAVIPPRWSPDGEAILFLRRDQDRDNGKVQIWIARADGSGARAVTHADADVESAAWSADGQRVIYAVRTASARAGREIVEEGRSGWIYDERILPTHGPMPEVPLQPLDTVSISPAGADSRPATGSERAMLDAVADPENALHAAASDGRVAAAVHRGGNPYAPLELSVAAAGAAPGESPAVKCRDASCDGAFLGIWWAPGGRSLLYLRREGWNKEVTALYRWSGKVGSKPVAILKTDDVLLGCQLGGNSLICTRENSTTPRRVTRIDTLSGKLTDLFDPNPEFRKITLGKVERLRWRNNLGLEAWGDLALPPGYREGTRLPMVVVQYESRGFLRGGTGDDYPIFALAARGFAVLSIERPPSVTSLHPEISTAEQFLKIYHQNWAERRSMQSVIEVGVKAAIDRGAADPERLGITGLSDGASAVRWALINSDLFKVAAVSTCCIDENALIYNGLAVQKQFEAMGYAPTGGEGREFWTPYSLALNARRMNRPLLMQLSDDEYLSGVNTLAVLKTAGQPIEMFVFPGEHHKKWQPAHRAAAYERNLDWFSFWLQGQEDPDPAKRAQYARWENMRDHPRSSP